MKQKVIGIIINNNRIDSEQKLFMKIAKQAGVGLEFFNIAKNVNEDEIKQFAKKCSVIYNDAGEYLAIEFTKTFENFGVKVVESSKTYENAEDKWMFYLACEKNKIPTPKTILLSDTIEAMKKELNAFNHWPVILKRVHGEKGEYVDRAENVSDAIKKVQKFWDGGTERLPVLAQQFVLSDSYRVLLIDGKIVQTARKKRSGWKATGCEAERFTKFKLSPEMVRICKKLYKISGIKVCGIDFMKDKDKFLAIEINAEPSFNFFDSDKKKIITELLTFLKKY